MRSYTHDRETFIYSMAKEGLYMAQIRALLRYAGRLQALAVAECSGIWPYRTADPADMWTCHKCGDAVARSTIKSSRLGPKLQHGTTYTHKMCETCRLRMQVEYLLAEANARTEHRAAVAAAGADGTPTGLFVAIFGGDPRGYVLKLRVPSGSSNTWGGPECGIGVPARG